MAKHMKIRFWRTVLVVISCTAIAGVFGVDIQPKFQIIKVTDDSARTRLPCDFTTISSDRPIIEWYKGDTATGDVVVRVNTAGELQAKGNFTGRVKQDTKGSIFLNSPNVHDTSNYTCFVLITTDIPPTARSTVYLNVTKQVISMCVNSGAVGSVILIVLESLVLFTVVILLLIFRKSALLHIPLEGTPAKLWLAILVVFVVLSLTSLVLLCIYLNRGCAVRLTVWTTGASLGSLCISGSVAILVLMLWMKKISNMAARRNVTVEETVPLDETTSTETARTVGTEMDAALLDHPAGIRYDGEEQTLVEVPKGSTGSRCEGEDETLVEVPKGSTGSRYDGVEETLVEVPKGSIEDIATTSGFTSPLKGRPETRRNELGDRIRDQTDVWLRAPSIFIVTRTTEAADSILNEKGCVVIIGNPGDGKTSLGRYLLSEHRKHGYEPYLIHSAEEWRFCWDPSVKQIFLIDDALGNNFLNQNQVECWLSLHAELESSLANAKFVFISTRPIYRSCSEKADRRKQFGMFLENVLDMRSTELSLNKEEKTQMIEGHCSDKNVELTKLDLVRILDSSESALGFPECCRLFVSDDKFREKKDESSIFTKPAKMIKKQLAIFETSPDKSFRYVYSLLVLTMLNGGRIQLSELYPERDEFAKARVHEIFCIVGLSTKEASRRLREAMDAVLDTFLTLDLSNECLKFSHDSTLHVLALEFGKRYTKHFLEYGALSLVLEYIRTGFTPANTTGVIILDSTVEVELVRCLWRHIARDDIWTVVQHPSLLDDSAQSAFIHSLMSDTSIREEVIQYEKTHFDDDRSLLFVAVACGGQGALEAYLCYSEVLFQETERSDLPRRIDIVNSTPSVDWYGIEGGSRSKVPLASVAAYYNRVKTLEYLDTVGCDIFAKDEQGRGPMHHASYRGQMKTVEYLLHIGCSASSTDIDGRTPLHFACTKGQNAVAKVLIKNGADPKKTTKDGSTALHMAGMAAHLGVVKALLENEASVDAKDEEGNTTLHVAAREGHVAIVKALIERGADVNAERNNGSTALHLSAGHGNTAVTKTLLDHHADVTHKDSDLNTVGHIAAARGSIDVLTLLSQIGMPLDEQNDKQRIPLHYAALKGHLKAVQLLASSDSVKAKDSHQATPLHLAARADHRPVMRFFLDNGADASSRDKKGKTPVHYAAERGHVQSVLLLITHGASLTDRDNDGRTPIHAAAQGGHVSLVQFFINHGVDVLVEDNKGRTPIQAAAGIGHADVVQVLLAHMAYPSGDTKLSGTV